MKSKDRTKIFIKSVLAVLILVFIYVTGYTIGIKEGRNYSPPNYVKNGNEQVDNGVDFSLFWQAWNKARELYIGQTNSQEMLYGAISGMVASFGDPYSVFLKPSDNEKLASDLSGKFDGIGAELTTRDNQIVVVAPLSGTPSEKAGLKPKDIIIKIDDKNTSDMTLSEAVDLIRGEAGTIVKLTVIRSKVDEPLEISITRAKIEVPSVSLDYTNYKGNNIAILKITQFGDDTVDLATQYAEEISKSSAKGIILDLRSDPGGYLDSSIKVSGLFVSKNSVAVSEVDKNNEKKDYKTSNEPILLKYPVVVLVNSGTASAAEIVTGALRDNNRATIVGTKTFGKGSVQAIEPLLFGSSLKITIAKWLTPNGSEINGVGISPDVAVENQDDNTDNQLERAKAEIIKQIIK